MKKKNTNTVCAHIEGMHVHSRTRTHTNEGIETLCINSHKETDADQSVSPYCCMRVKQSSRTGATWHPEPVKPLDKPLDSLIIWFQLSVPYVGMPCVNKQCHKSHK